MHNIPTLVFLALFSIFAYFIWGRDFDDQNDHLSQDNANTAQAESKAETLSQQDCRHDSAAPVDKFSCDFDQQIRQVLALNAAIRQLQSDYSAICADRQIDKTDPACVIISEQLRIAACYAAEVSRHAFSWVGDSGVYRPTLAEASWAFTAAHLSLSFASVRVLNLSAS